MMRIFKNKVLNESDMDFTMWETFNGDYVNISMVSSSYLERSMDLLEQFMDKYPNHVNYGIWMQYVEKLEEELISRERTVIGEYVAY